MHPSRVRVLLSQPSELHLQHLVPERLQHHISKSTVTLRTIIPTFQVVGYSFVQFPNALLRSQKLGRTRNSTYPMQSQISNLLLLRISHPMQSQIRILLLPSAQNIPSDATESSHTLQASAL
jgi:hypothetical protein